MASVLMAIGHPLNIAMFFASILAGLLADLRLIPIGLALWLVMVISVALNPSDRLNSSIDKRSNLSQRFQPLMSRIQRSQANLFTAIEALPGDAQNYLKPVYQAVGQLADKAMFYCQRLTPLENYRLVTTRGQNIDEEKRQLQARIDLSQNPDLKRELTETFASLEKREMTLNSVTAHLDKADAVLASLGNELDTTLLEIMQLPSLESSDLRSKVAQILQKLKAELAELDEIGKIPPTSN